MVQRLNNIDSMANVKIDFVPSLTDDRVGSVVYRITHRSVVRSVDTPYVIGACEWSEQEAMLIESPEALSPEMKHVRQAIGRDMAHLHHILAAFERRGQAYACDDIVAAFVSLRRGKTLFTFAAEVVEGLRMAGKSRVAETYASTINSFSRFRDGVDIELSDIEHDVIVAYESYLRQQGVSANSSSFYMRNLRALYNRAVEKSYTQQLHPFRHVYTGVERTPKRAISLKTIRQIKALNLSHKPSCDFARDMFLFSFYTRGMSFVDMAYLRKCNLQYGTLVYRRRKTGQQLIIKWESCMQAIVDKYDTGQSEYLLPIISSRHEDPRLQYLRVSHRVNRCLKRVGEQLQIHIPLTMYVARHAWASIAKSKHVPLSVISEGMGHDSERTTRIYLASLDHVAIDRANSLILRAL